MMRILVVRLSALGDVVHTLPVVAALRRAYPDAQLDWFVDERFDALVGCVPVVDARITWPGKGPHRWRERMRVLGRLRRARYDAAIDVQGLVKSAAAARLSGARRVIGFARAHLREPAARWFYTETVPATRAEHVIAKNLRLAEHLGATPTPWEFPLAVPPSPAVDATRRQLDTVDDARFVVLLPGTAWPSKCWTAARYGQLAARIRAAHGLRSAVVWGPDDKERAVAAAAASDGAAHLAPPTGVADLVAYAQSAAVVVGGDTGPLHLAAAAGARVVGLYGPSDPVRNGPWDPGAAIISRFETCRCRPRGERRGGQGLAVRHCHEARSCLADISVDDVFTAVGRCLAASGPHA